MDIPKLETLNPSNCTERFIRIHYFEFWKYICDNFPKELKWTEKLYWYYNGLAEGRKCVVCGAPTKFISFKTGYREFCSYKCMNSCKDVQERKIETSRKHYGCDNPMHSKVCKEKLKQTFIERYGVENPFQSERVKEQIRQTNQRKYGCDYPMQSELIRKKSIQSCTDKYGVQHNSQIDFVKEHKKSIQPESIAKSIATYKENYLKSHPSIINISENDYVCKCPHPECDKCIEKQFTIPKSIYHSRCPQQIELCTTLLPISPNFSGTSIEMFIRNILDEHNIEYETNVRNIISPQELDIWIPSKHIAIECNSVYFHNTHLKSRGYHRDKFIKCQENGIQLLTIWEDWIVNKPEIVKSIILSKLGIYNQRIYARQCNIREITSKESNQLLERTHIQGKCTSQVRYGLYYEDKLVATTTFGRNRNMIIGGTQNKWELVRFCCESGIQIVGGAKKMLSHFIKDYKPETLYSFSSNDISAGNLYKRLGFEKCDTNLSYWYVNSKDFSRWHRSTFTKNAIVRRGWKTDKECWREVDVMEEHGYYQIYDSGQTKWELKVEN